LAALQAHRSELIDPTIAAHKGRIVKLMGDGALVEFASVVDAVTCALAIQQGMVERNRDIPSERRIVFRIGVNLGDVIVEGEDLYGDGVNVAARLEGLAEPGGLCLSGTAYETLRGKLDLDLEDLGEQRVKNMDRPVRVYRARPAADAAAPGKASPGGDASPLELPDKPSLAVLP
ncbi:MAG: adenylate/guanylate cyclase domain-containing protein, partial [Gammaproteobacteria bacterium]|nr:adenylate/guanylate cyclase domain-containing protein [Gammaproteobacteria bacterium]